MNFNIWTARLSVAFKIIGFFYTCMLHYFFLIYISYICIDVILIFFVFMEIVMLFLRAKVIPVIPQIHGNVMCPLFVLNFIFEPLFVHAPHIIVFLKFHLGTDTHTR